MLFSLDIVSNKASALNTNDIELVKETQVIISWSD